MRQGRRGGVFKADNPPREGGLRPPGQAANWARPAGERVRKTQQQELTNRGWPTVTSTSLCNSALNPLATLKPCAKRSIVPRAFADEFAKDVNELTRNIETEVVLESGLHVPGVAAGSCYEKFGLPSEIAPPLVDPPAAVGVPSGLESDHSMDLAICLATPSDEEGRNDVKETITRAFDDLEIKEEIRAEIQNVLVSVEEIELGSQRNPQDISQPPRFIWRRRSAASSGAIDFDADATEGEETGVEGNVVEIRLKHFRSRPA